MTRIECDICMQKGWAVHISDKSPKAEFLKSEFYQVVSAHKCKEKHNKTWQYSYAIAPEKTWRSWVTVTTDDIYVDENKISC